MSRSLLVLLLAATSAAQSPHDPAGEVNPFIGTSYSTTEANRKLPPGADQYGNTLPGAVRPFGMLYWSPDYVDVNSGTRNIFYHLQDKMTRGFSLTHMSGPGCSVYGEAPILPMLGTPTQPASWTPAPYTAAYDPTDQVAEPGYYAITLASGIHVQLAANTRSGIGTFTFPRGGQPHTILVDLSRDLVRVNDAEVSVSGRTMTGSVTAGEMCMKSNHYRVYFALEVEEQPSDSGTFDELAIAKGDGGKHSPFGGAYLSFPPTDPEVHLKVAISFVSVANAQDNLRREIPGWDFDAQRHAARAAWNDVLGRMEVHGGSAPQRHVFYTALYHSLLSPSVFSDVNGEYMGFDDRVHQGGSRTMYANYSAWDTYRCQMQLIAMLDPHVASDMAQSLLEDAKQGGGLPVWSMANEEGGFMVGDPSGLILASLYAFGAGDFDAHAALADMMRNASDPSVHSRWDAVRPYLDLYLAKGYIGINPTVYPGSASTSLEYMNGDFAISRLAQQLGDTADARTYLARAGNWRKLMDPETHYIRPRDGEGNFVPNFTAGSGVGFIEGNSAQYTWMVPYDLPGVIGAVGGADVANARLDTYFSQYGGWHGGPYFLIENEPSFGDPWIYNWTGEPWRAQEVARKTLNDLFLDTPGGIPGNDDLGATSAWAVFAQLGIYPEIPSVAGFTLSSPIFPETVLHLKGHDVRLVAQGAPQQLYVQRVAVDGAPVTNWWISWDKLSHARTVTFDLGSAPSKAPGEMPPSFPPRP
jgi:predicted alpha-1,2-mannosidase